MHSRGFTLIELLVVVGIMGMMGAISVGGYRAMRRGIEERGVIQSVNQFVHAAYERAIIDRQSVMIAFSNVTRKEEDDESPEEAYGRAVAVRQYGRITCKAPSSQLLIDEFADLRQGIASASHRSGKSAEDIARESKGQQENAIDLYRFPFDSREPDETPSRVSQIPLQPDTDERIVFADGSTSQGSLELYGFYAMTGFGNWSVGDGYGMEIAEIELPIGYIFGSSQPSKNLSDPIRRIGACTFNPASLSTSVNMTISAYRPGSSGELTVTKIGEVDFSDLTESN